MEEPKKDLSKATSPVSAGKKSPGILRYSGMAMQMLGTILVFTYAGYKLDAWQANKTPIWTLILSLTSIAASLYLLIRSMPKAK